MNNARELRILSIDDDAAIRYALKAIFDHAGWTGYMAGNVKEGLALFKEHKPHLVLIDYHLPQINGLEGVAMLRRLSPSVPIIVFTVEESQEIANRFLEVGATDFALKPIKAPDLMSRIALHIRLLESDKRGGDPEPMLAKGIGAPTLALILSYLQDAQDYQTANQIANGTGLAYPTTYRYLQYLLGEGRIDLQVDYGKVGRPKQRYRLKPDS